MAFFWQSRHTLDPSKLEEDFSVLRSQVRALARQLEDHEVETQRRFARIYKRQAIDTAEKSDDKGALQETLPRETMLARMRRQS